MSYSVSLKGEEAKRSIQQLRESLQAERLAAKVIYSGGEDLDILPAHASKGKGLEFLLAEVKALIQILFCPLYVSLKDPMSRGARPSFLKCRR